MVGEVIIFSLLLKRAVCDVDGSDWMGMGDGNGDDEELIVDANPAVKSDESPRVSIRGFCFSGLNDDEWAWNRECCDPDWSYSSPRSSFW